MKPFLLLRKVLAVSYVTVKSYTSLRSGTGVRYSSSAVFLFLGAPAAIWEPLYPAPRGSFSASLTHATGTRQHPSSPPGYASTHPPGAV